MYGALRNLIPTYEHNLFYMWRNAAFVADSNSFIGVVCVQLAVGSIVGGLSLRNAQYIKKLGQHGAFRDTVRSGLFFVFFTFPWGGIGCSMVSTVWLARASGLSELAVPVSLLMFTVIQALLSKLLAELMHGDAA